MDRFFRVFLSPEFFSQPIHRNPTLKTHFSCGTRRWNWVKDNLSKVEVKSISAWLPLDCQKSANLKRFLRSSKLKFDLGTACTRNCNDAQVSWSVPWCAELRRTKRKKMTTKKTIALTKTKTLTNQDYSEINDRHIELTLNSIWNSRNICTFLEHIHTCSCWIRFLIV